VPARHFLHALVKPATAASQPRLVITRTGTTLADTIEIAGDSGARRRGLLGRDGLATGTALVIAPCSAVHTFGMRFSIDVIFAARDGRVMKIARDVAPRRFAVAWGAFAAIEMAAGEVGRSDVQIGDCLTVA
jgi:uncharacterized membrane protein (UPF0127 family)